MAQQEETIDQLIARIDRENRQYFLEVRDVVREVDTPCETSDSDDDPIPLWDGEWDLASRLLRTNVTPTQPTSYSALYEDEAYRSYQRRARLKFENVRGCFSIRYRQTITQMMDSERYRLELAGLYEKYPEHGGRQDLYMLIAMYRIHREEALQTTSTFEGINEDDDEDDDDDDDDNDDNDNDDDNGDDKENRGNDRKRKSSADIMSQPFKTIRF